MQGSKREDRCHDFRIRTHLHYLFLWFCLMGSSFIYTLLTLFSFKKGAFFRNGYVSPMRSISISISITQAFFNFKLFFRIKVSENAFNFNQIKSYVYSIFYLICKIWYLFNKVFYIDICRACFILLLLLLLLLNVVTVAVS